MSEETNSDWAKDTVTLRCPQCDVVVMRIEQLSTLDEPRHVDEFMGEKCRYCSKEAA